MKPRLKVDSAYMPLLVRAALLTLSGLATALAYSPAMAIVPTLLLLFVAGLASIPLPDGTPRAVQALAEGIAAAIIVGALAGRADLFLPYLLVPLVVAGLTSGVGAALSVAVLSSAALIMANGLVTPPGRTVPTGDGLPRTPVASPLDPKTIMLWVAIFFGVALVSAWARRVLWPESEGAEPAYTDAHRLLSELHVVARQLSLGLDPQTLAAALVDETTRAVAGSTGTVLVRSPAGRFVPILGEHPSTFAESVVLDAWVAAEAVRRTRDGVTCAALPVLMGERVVAVLVLVGREQFGDEALEAARRRVSVAGPRLASALLFDDVRRLATDDERVRLAREIHDGIAQDMASVGYLVDDIARDATPDVADRLAKLREHIGGLVGELRLSIFDLRAGVDEKVGLSRTLADYVQRVGSQSGLVVHLSTDEGSSRLPVAVEVEILRIVQEAVTNVRKHARATNLWLAVSVAPPRARVTVTDDGCGIQDRHTGLTPYQGIRMGGMGLTGMHERARRIGARLAVNDRLEGSGTVVELVIDPEIALHRARSRRKIPPDVPGMSDSQANDQVVVTAEPGDARAEGTLARLLRNLPRNGEVNRGR